MDWGVSRGLIACCRIAAIWLLAAGPAAHAAMPGDEAAEPRAGLPTGVCVAGFCGRAQRGIWTRFERGSGLAAGSGVYAGVCYVHHDLFDPDREHHVGFLIERIGGQPRLLMRFSFFAAANPFGRLDPEAARTRLAEAVLPVSLYDGYAYADYADRRFFARYWLRRDPDSGRVLLVSYFGYRTTIICDAAETGA